LKVNALRQVGRGDGDRGVGGIVGGDRKRVVRGRMPEALVARAKKRAGIDSDTELIEVALASLAVADDYTEWLLSRRATIDPATDLEF